MKRKSSWSSKFLCLCLGLVLAFAMVFSACDSKEPTPTPPPGPDKTATLTLSQANAEMVVGESTSFTYTLKDSTDTVTFSENNSTLASYTDNSGTVTVTAKAAGSYVLTVKAGTLEKTFTATIGDIYRQGYTPTLFDKNVTHTDTVLADGVRMLKNEVTLKNGNIAYIYTVEVDLNKASIQAGTKGNVSSGFKFDKAVPYAQAQAWENATGGQVYASLNADFFGSQCVNAFVKDGIIIKDSHNDNGYYKWEDSEAQTNSSDVPVSAPMLFGVKGNTAQIAPIKAYTGDVKSEEVKKELVQAKLSYAAAVDGKEGSVVVTSNPTSVSSTTFAFSTSKSYTVSSGAYVKIDVSNGLKKMQVLESQKVTKSTRLVPESGKTAYLVAGRTNKDAIDLLTGITTLNTVSIEVASPDGMWNGYDTILGCRHALVVNDAIPDTVALEFSNGTKRTDIPRSAVGLKPDGKVVLFAVEAMRYYKLSDNENDGYGLNLAELAEFAYFYGCSQAANFDGGGSTQLVTRAAGENTATVVVRSADKIKKNADGTYSTVSNAADNNITNDERDNWQVTRPVMNSILITSKED